MLSAKTISKINARYHDIISSFYDTYQEQNHPKVVALYKDFFQEIFFYLNKVNSSKLHILDIGCGTGYLEQFLKPEKNSIVGIDVSAKLLTYAKKKYPRVAYKLKDAYDLDNGSYDLIVENSVLHHIKDYEKVLDKMVSLLKPRGCIFLGCEPNYFCYHYLSFMKTFFRKFLPDKRELKTPKIKEEYERFAEYHMYFSDGINPFKLKKFFQDRGFFRVDVKFSSREFFAGMIDRVNLHIIDYIPNALMDASSRLSRLFYLIAYR